MAKVGDRVLVKRWPAGQWEAAEVIAVLPDGRIEAQLVERPLVRYAGLVPVTERDRFCWKPAE